jgi:hypothetical protein
VRLEVLVEERSAETALNILLPKILGSDAIFQIRVFQGKHDLLSRLPARLAGYSTWVHSGQTRIVVLVDRDDDDCRELKQRLEEMVAKAGLTTRSTAATWAEVTVLPRIAIEELEAWFIGDVPALHAAYPRVPRSTGARAGLRDPDAITGTWQALERLLQKRGYQLGGLAKVDTARAIAEHMDVDTNRSASFAAFRDGVRHLAGVTA